MFMLSAFVTCVIVLLSSQPSFSIPYGGGSLLRDLEANDLTTFQTYASSWTVGPNGLVSSQRVSYCDGYYLLGGYNILQPPYGYFERTYNGLTYAHNMIRFSIKIQVIDAWDSADTFKLQFGSLPELVGWNLAGYGSSYGSYRCGGSGSSAEKEPDILTVVAEVPHSGTSLTLRVTSWLNQSPLYESMGFRDISMTFYTLANPPTSATMCGSWSYALPKDWCACEGTNYYMAPAKSGTCYPCDSSCATCSSAFQYNCYSCYPGYYLTGSTQGSCAQCDSTCKTCTGSSAYTCLSCPVERYLTILKNCVDDCPLPLINDASEFTEHCSSPCTYPNYLYPDMSCRGSCHPLMTKRDLVSNYFYLCIFPCKAEEFAVFNGSCSKSCPSPLTTTLLYTRRFCYNNCAASETLYWDGLCEPTTTVCAFPLIPYTEGTGAWVRYYCGYPCDAWEYLYWNGSCLSTCDLPLKKRVSHDSNFCDFPCSSPTPIAFWDGSCSATCATSTKPLILKVEGTPSRSFCHFPCQIEEFLYWNTSCSTICVPPLVSSWQNSRSFCGYPCSGSQYLNWDGACVPSCSTPPYVIRNEAGQRYCDFPCAPPLPYLYWNGSCLATCSAPLTVTIKGPAYFCNHPCALMTDFLYFNGTCAPGCDGPLAQRIEGTPSRKFCDFGCEDYLYWNQTCSSECPKPLVFRAVAGRKYCDYPCFGTSDFLYWNSSCLSTCSAPLKEINDGSVKYCLYSCSSDEYLNWDGTCTRSCETPLKEYIEGIRKYCITGCSSSEYLYWDGSCSIPCEAPLRGIVHSGGGNTQPFCYQPCPNTAYYYYFDAKTCRPSCPGPYYANYTKTPYLSCISVNMTLDSWFASHFLVAPDVADQVTVIRVVKLMEHMRYLEIAMPPRLERLIMSKGRNILSFNFGWSMSDQMQSYFVDKTLPEAFARHGLASSFLVNFWKDFTMMGVIVFLAVIFTILENICKVYNMNLVKCFFERCRALTKWNLLIVFVAMSMDDIILYSSLQFRSLGSSRDGSYDYMYIAFSLLSTVAALILSVGLLFGAFFWLYKVRVEQKEAGNTEVVTPEHPGFMNKWQDYQVLFQGYNPSSIFTQSFYLIYVVRVCYLPMLVASYLYPYPLPQTIVQVIISIGTLAFIILMKPLQRKINYVQLIISESLVFLMNSCLLILKCFEIGGVKQNSFSSILVGDIIIGGNVFFNSSWIIFMAVKLLNEGREIYKFIKSQAEREQGVWMDLFMIWIQQGGMGFEEVKIRNTFSEVNNWIDDSSITKNEILKESQIEGEEKESNEYSVADDENNFTSIEHQVGNSMLTMNQDTMKKKQENNISVRSLRSKNSRKHLFNSQNQGISDGLESRVNLGNIANELPPN